ncbi:hypothetical protein [Chryseobacterium proteolyticum]|uniref:hypothetical protein n=1 Tax=Chryseobacterium proteolyticum TaxID=118127 RepID=UPI003983462E
MALINPETLLKRLQEAQKQVPKLVQAELKKDQLEKINQDNLLHGKDSEGGNMPLYSPRYRRGNLFYAQYKRRSNPFNRGRWDLKHWWNKKYDGLFYKSITVKVTLKEVVFDTNYNPTYMKDIYYHKSKKRILGITKKQFIQVQITNKPRIKEKLLSIINNGR